MIGYRQCKSKKVDLSRCEFYHWNFKEILMIKHSLVYKFQTMWLLKFILNYMAGSNEQCDHITEMR